MSKRTLLLADDSVTIQKVVNLTFADEGIEVITVGDGDTAMERISESAPNVILADVHMPGLNGYQICESVRQNPQTKDLPVVLLVGSFEPFDEEEAARVGANSYLTKPFQSIRQLVSQVSELMELSAGPRDESVAEIAPPAEEPETSDIDSLYHRSFTEPENEESETGPPRYVDAGMDDEMIEASHVGEVDGAETAVTDDPDEVDTGDYIVNVYPEDHAAAVNSSYDSPINDPNAATASAVAKSEPSPYFEPLSMTEPMSALDSQQTLRDIEFDEVLELPPIENGKTLEFTTQSMSMQEGGREVVSLSPELMDIIVQRVVDKLSEKF